MTKRRFSLVARQERGFAIIMVLILLAVLMGGIAVLFGVLTSTGRTAGSMIDRRKSFYQCDGTARVITKIAQDFTLVSDQPGATDAGMSEMQRYVCEKTGSTTACTSPYLPDIVDPGYEIERFGLTPLAADMQPTILQSGAYINMQANEMPILLALEMRRTATGNRCEIEQEVSIASISMFQFFLFAEKHTNLGAAPPMEVSGRVHTNDDFCTSGNVKFERVTSAGRILHQGDAAKCRVSQFMSDAEIWDGTGAFPANTVALSTAADHIGAGASWRADSLATWNGNVQDMAHGVTPLRLPLAQGIAVQSGNRADGATVADNANSTRYLVDPVMPGDTPTERGAKLACQADIRIINGVWFMRDTDTPTAANPCGGWPGTPIWSDHPGRFTTAVGDEDEEVLITAGGQAVGQEDIADAEGWDFADDPLLTAIPTRYSYYRVQRAGDPNPGEMVPPPVGHRAVVSYGTLKRRGGVAGNEMVPGHWISNGMATNVCDAAAGFAAPAEMVAWDTGACATDDDERANSLLNAARTGFADPTMLRSAPAGAAVGRQLAINFDVGAFRAALADTTGHELGTYFPGNATGTGRRFNGIVWISNTWDQSLDGFGTGNAEAGGASIFVPQGDNDADSDQPAGSAPAPYSSMATTSNPALPYPLCSANLDGDDMTDANTEFEVPDCDDYEERGARPLGVRVINAKEIGSSDPADADVLSDGLSVVTNVVAYVIGDLNTEYGGAARVDANWVPVMIAGDVVMLHSNSWQDDNAPWGEPDPQPLIDQNGSGALARPASETTYNFCMISGQSENHTGVWNGGIQNMPLQSEDWNGVNLNINGSLVKAFAPIYPRWQLRGNRRPPVRNWAFDPKLNSLDNQPPGAPRFDIQAVRTWRR